MCQRPSNLPADSGHPTLEMNPPVALVADDPARPPLDDQELLDAYSHAVVSVVDAVGPSVVSIGINTARHRGEGRGSGVVISSDGHVLTNSHVIQGATAITVSLTDGRRFPASVLGDDPATDLALIRVEAPALPTARLGQSARLASGASREPSIGASRATSDCRVSAPSR